MPQAEITLVLPEGVWIRELSTAHPETEFRVLAALPADDTGVGLLEVRGEDLQAVVTDIAESDDIVSIDVLQVYGDEALVEFETTQPVLLFPARESGIPFEPPVNIRDGEASLSVTASRSRLSAFASPLDAFDVEYHVDSICETVDVDDLLTETQQELVLAALAHGYYDTPRGCTLTELADHVGLAESSASKTLHRAEECIIKQFARAQFSEDQYPTPDAV